MSGADRNLRPSGRGGRQGHGVTGVDVAPSLWGGLAEHLYLTQGAVLHKVDKTLPAELAVMFNPLGAGVRWALHLGGVGIGAERLPASTMGTYVVGLEGALAAASMIAGGTAGKCPDLRISFSHAAGGFPLMLPRAQYFWGGAWNEEPVVPERAIAHDDGPSPIEYARRFYYDSLVFDRRAIRYLIDLLGHDRLLVGSDFPAMPREDPAGRTLRDMNLPPVVLEAITGGNALHRLGLPHRDLGTHPRATAQTSGHVCRGYEVCAAGRVRRSAMPRSSGRPPSGRPPAPSGGRRRPRPLRR